MKPRTAPETLATLYQLQRLGIHQGLEIPTRLLEAVGNPQERYASVHVAGTNGKGSTSAMVASVLHAAGYRVGLYTSPHIRRFNERIQVNGTLIDDSQVVGRTQRLLDIAEGSGLQPTFFEFTTAMAFAHFADLGVDVAVVEVGMGGRLDATNVLLPRVSVITEIARDHEGYLGGSLEAIAREKAGIIKSMVPVVTTAANPEALGVLGDTCLGRGAPLKVAGDHFHTLVREAGLTGSRLDYRGLQWELHDVRLGLAGRHQAANAAGAMAALEVLGEQGFDVPETAVRTGLAEIQWLGRFQILPGTPPVLLDGAHNPAGARVLADALQELCQISAVAGVSDPQGLIMVLGILADKAVEEMVEILAPLSRTLIATRPDTPRAADPARIASEAQRHTHAVQIRGTVAEALHAALSLAGPGDLVCVAGSLYTVGEALEAVSDVELFAGAR